MRRRQNKLFPVALSAIALFLLMGVTFALSPVVPYLFEGEETLSSDGSGVPLKEDASSHDAGSPRAERGAAGVDLMPAVRGWIPSAAGLQQIDLSVLTSAAAAPAPDGTEAPGEGDGPAGAETPDGPVEPAKAESPSEPDKSDKAEKPSQTDKPDKAEKTDQADKPDKDKKPDKADKPDESEKPGEAGEPEKTEAPSEPDVPDEPEGPAETGEPEGGDTPGGPVEPSGTDGAGAAGVQAVGQQNVNGQTYVSLAAYAQAIDPAASVSWDGWAMTVTAGGTTVVAVNGRAYVVANDRYLYVPSGVQVIDGQLYVPDSVASKAFSGLQSGDSYYDQQALFWLSRIIYRESGNQGLEGQMAVGNVILNRVAHPDFPNSIEGVLAQKNQFPSYASGVLQQTSPSATSVTAAKLVLDGGVVAATRGATYFSSGSNSWAAQNKQYIATFGGHNFYG